MTLICINRETFKPNPLFGPANILYYGPMPIARGSSDPWYYEYLSADVECRFCGWKGSNRKLTDYYLDDEDGEHVDNICPECQKPDCCEIEYENPADIAKELGL